MSTIPAIAKLKRQTQPNPQGQNEQEVGRADMKGSTNSSNFSFVADASAVTRWSPSIR